VLLEHLQQKRNAGDAEPLVEVKEHKEEEEDVVVDDDYPYDQLRGSVNYDEISILEVVECSVQTSI
jgi:hypothetical protein